MLYYSYYNCTHNDDDSSQSQYNMKSSLVCDVHCISKNIESSKTNSIVKNGTLLLETVPPT